MNRAMVAGGWARAQVDTPTFGDVEAEARSRQIGMWQGHGSKVF